MAVALLPASIQLLKLQQKVNASDKTCFCKDAALV